MLCLLVFLVVFDCVVWVFIRMCCVVFVCLVGFVVCVGLFCCVVCVRLG